MFSVISPSTFSSNSLKLELHARGSYALWALWDCHTCSCPSFLHNQERIAQKIVCKHKGRHWRVKHKKTSLQFQSRRLISYPFSKTMVWLKVFKTNRIALMQNYFIIHIWNICIKSMHHQIKCIVKKSRITCWDHIRSDKNTFERIYPTILSWVSMAWIVHICYSGDSVWEYRKQWTYKTIFNHTKSICTKQRRNRRSEQIRVWQLICFGSDFDNN